MYFYDNKVQQSIKNQRILEQGWKKFYKLIIKYPMCFTLLQALKKGKRKEESTKGWTCYHVKVKTKS